MSLQDRMSVNFLQQLNDFKKDLANATPSEKNVFTDEENEQIRLELLRQAEQEESDGLDDDDYFSSLSRPSHEGNQKLVEVEYLGRIGYVDISFESLDEDLEENEYQVMIDALEVMAYGSDSMQRKNASKDVEKFGEKAITMIFRECRKFDITDESRKQELVHLLSRLTTRSYKGRKIIKAVLEKANSSQHVALAILAAGSIREREAVSLILNHMNKPEFFGIGLHALFNIRDKDSIVPIIKSIKSLDLNRNDLIDQAIHIAPRFAGFGPETVRPVFQAYMESEKKELRPIFTIALRSFKEDAIPMLKEVLDSETDESKLNPICMSLGGLKMSFSTNLLKEAFYKYPNKKKAILKGFSYTRDTALIPIIVEELTTTSDVRIKAECLGALANLIEPKINLDHVIRPYLHEKGNRLYLGALNCMVRLGDQESLERYIHLLMNGDEEEQYILQKNLLTMSFKFIVKIAEKILNCPDEKAILLVSTLQRFNLVPQEVGAILMKKLDQNPIPALRLEIYRLIGKHVNKRREILPQEVLYKARKEETNPRIIRDLDQIIQHMRKNGGRISTIRQEA
jgi:hypothetical protein